MNKKFSTFLAGVLLAGSVGAFAATIAPTELKTGDVVFVKNDFTDNAYGNLTPTYLKAQGDKGIITVSQAEYKLDTKAKIDSVSWKVTVRENAGGLKDYKFTNVATNVVMAYDAPKQEVGYSDENTILATTDSAKVVTATDLNSYWSVDKVASSDKYTIAYMYHTEGVDSVVAIGSYRSARDKPYNMARTARIEFDTDMKTSLASLAGASATMMVASFGEWQLDKDAVDAAMTAMYKIPYSELNTSRIRSTNIQGLVNFEIIPVDYNPTTDEITPAATPSTATQFIFKPVSQIGLDNPKYYAIDTARYNIAGAHQNNVYAYGLSTDTIVTDATKHAGTTNPRNGLKVFTLMREVGNADSIIFRPEAIVKYNSAAAPYFTVAPNPSTTTLTLGTYTYANGEVVLGQAKLDNTKLVSTVFAENDATGADRVEGILRPYAFTAPVYPNIAEGYYFIQNKAADKANAEEKNFDKYYVYSLCGNEDGTAYVDEASADNSYQVWVVSGKDDKLKVQNRYTKEVLGDVLYEVGDGLYSTGNLDTLAFVTADAEKGAIDYFAIDPADINYKKFALGLVNGIGANIYVTTVADSVLGVKADDASLMLYPTIGTVTKYGVNDELLATAYTFKTKDGKFLGKNAAGKYVVSKNVPATPLYFKVAADGEYYIVESALTSAIATQITTPVAYLTTKATDNYLTTNTVTGCPDGQDRYTIETPAAPKYMTLEKGWYNIKTDGREDMLTMGTDSAAIFRRISADGLKASYGEADFKLWIDTAANNANGDLNVPTYFILKGREYSEDKDTMSGNFLGRTRNDSLMFVEAKRIVNKDTLLIGDNKLKGNDVKPYQFAFPFVSGESGAVYVQEQKDSKYLRIVNEYVTLTADKDEAIIINPVNTGEATANEGISTSEVSVIGGNGQVTINGAAGKKVVISNMLGQIKANTVITSDNETIAAPAGIVIVAVEGEEAVKAMVE